MTTDPPHRDSGHPPNTQRTSRDQLLQRGNERDGVSIVARVPVWPESDTAAEKRAERGVQLAFTVATVLGIGFVVVFMAWPHHYVIPSDPDYTLYSLYTPALGVTFGGAVAALSVGVISYAKKFYPEETSVQQHHLGGSEDTDRLTALAHFTDIAQETGIGRRNTTRRLALGGFGVLAAMMGFLALGGLVRNPWAGRNKAALWTTGWASRAGETVYLRAAGADPTDITLIRPEDMAPGAMQTVYPFRDSERGNEDRLVAAEQAPDNPVMLIRLPPDTPVTFRPGQEKFHYQDFYAFSKLCTHLGCPASLYDKQRYIALCPCHQSEFLITQYAKPIFGPATRPLPQLPISLSHDGRFIATGDFLEPVGPGFWEMRTKKNAS